MWSNLWHENTIIWICYSTVYLVLQNFFLTKQPESRTMGSHRKKLRQIKRNLWHLVMCNRSVKCFEMEFNRLKWHVFPHIIIYFRICIYFCGTKEKNHSKCQNLHRKCMKLCIRCGNHSESARNSVFFWKIMLPAEVFRDCRDKYHPWDMNILALVGFIFSCKPLGIEPISRCCKPCRLPGDQFQCTRVDKFMLYNSYLVLLGVFTAVNK